MPPASRGWAGKPSDLTLIEGWPMRYDHTARASRMKASALLRDMRRHLFSIADLLDGPAEAWHWTLSNVAGMHVYATPAGWHCNRPAGPRSD